MKKQSRSKTVKAFKRIDKDIKKRGTEGSLHATAKRAQELTKKGTIKLSYLNKLKKEGTPLQKKRANLALTYNKMRKKKK